MGTIDLIIGGLILLGLGVMIGTRIEMYENKLLKNQFKKQIEETKLHNSNVVVADGTIVRPCSLDSDYDEQKKLFDNLPHLKVAEAAYNAALEIIEIKRLIRSRDIAIDQEEYEAAAEIQKKIDESTKHNS